MNRSKNLVVMGAAVVLLGIVTLSLPDAAQGRSRGTCYVCVPSDEFLPAMDEAKAEELCDRECSTPNWLDHVEMDCEVPTDGYGDPGEYPWRAECAPIR